MVHKKYIKRGKKVFGPYYYQNYRVGGITKTRYLGRAPSDIKKNLLFNKNIFIVLGIAVLICLFAFSYPLFFRGLTGKVSLELSDSYEIGEQIKGNLNLNLKKGELIPADSILKISLGEQELEISISELIGLEQEVGDFYAEGSEISGRGGGFGFTGEKKVYPEISFKLLVNSVSEKEKEQEKEQKKERKIEEKNETEQVENITEIIEINETEQIENITEITELNETEIIEINETIAEINETEQSEEITENITQEQEITGTINETIEEDKKEDKKEEKETKETKEQEKEDKKEEKETEKEKLKITGEAVKQTTYLVDGVVTMQEPFVYGLEEEDFASIVSNSVKLYDASADADLLSLVVKDNKAEVTTDFYEIREGFGKDYALDETETITISLDNFNLTAEQGIIKLSLEYETLGIVEISKEINVDGDSHPPTQNQTEIIENITIPLTQNQTEIIENITEIPELNETLIEINETIANITEEIMQNYSVSTLQYKSIIDKPVKWKKIINKLSDENITLILPKETLNVSIKEISEEQEVQTSVLTGQVIGGNIVMNLEIQEQSFITRLYNSFLNSLRTITGLVISGQEDFVSVLIEGKSTDYEVEYYTRAPEVFEEKISEIKKKITISGPDVLHYQDILAYTKLPANISAENANAIKLYWIKSLSEVQEIDANLLALNETQEVSAYQPTLNQSEINETETPEVVNETETPEVVNETETPEVVNETEVNETIIDKQVSLLTGNVISEQEISETETINNIVQEAGEIQNL
ncbi:MAG: hypothetical protein KJ559_00950, partial [Nanoarchaeota archaeon]|nr:hypothetical protein [Nanoarchaeota archaeon]